MYYFGSHKRKRARVHPHFLIPFIVTSLFQIVPMYKMYLIYLYKINHTGTKSRLRDYLLAHYYVIKCLLIVQTVRYFKIK